MASESPFHFLLEKIAEYVNKVEFELTQQCLRREEMVSLLKDLRKELDTLRIITEKNFLTGYNCTELWLDKPIDEMADYYCVEPSVEPPGDDMDEVPKPDWWVTAPKWLKCCILNDEMANYWNSA